MFIDPISSWLVALIADGITVAGGQFGDDSILSKFDQERITWLNADIRRVKEKYGLVLPDSAFDQIQLHIRTTKNALSNKNTPIVIDLDNQEYIIEVLEAAAKWYSRYSSLEECRNKAIWYSNAAREARRQKAEYANALEIQRKKNAAEKGKQENINNICLGLGLIIIVAFVIFFFS